MANIAVKDLILDSSIRHLYESELALQGGKKRRPTVTPIVDDTPFVVPDIATLDLSNILLGFAPYSIF
jgi:hypothetical protein